MKKLLFLTMISGLFLCSFVSAQTVQERGIGNVRYSCPPNSMVNDVCAPSPNNMDDALEKAKMNAIGRYFASQGAAADALYERNEDEILDMMDRFILNETILNEQDRLGRYEVTVRVELNQGRLQNYIKEQTSAGGDGKSQKSEIVYLFMGREVGSVTQRGPITTSKTVAQVEAKSKGKTTETRGKTNASVEMGGYAGEMSQTTTGSKVELTRDQVAYRLLPMSNYDSAITSVFSQAGFSVVDSRFVLSKEDVNSVNNDYENGDDIKTETYASVANTLQGEGIPYLALATLDVDPPTIDSATGMNRVVVRAAVRVLDISSRFPREVASVPAYQIIGLGATDSEAQNKALSDSSQRAAREVVQRLNVLDVR